MDYKVTLAMPVYNVERYVERALLSALNQTFDSIEFLIVDDKGTDRSMDIVREIVSTHPRGKDVRIIDHVVNQGTGATKNSAIREAKGEYLFFMDSDDEITATCIQLLYDKMMEVSVDLVCGSFQDVLIDGTIRSHIYDACLLSNQNDIYDYQKGKNLPITVVTWNKLYRLSFIKSHDIKCIPNHLSEDQVFMFLVLFWAKMISFIDTPTYYYKHNDDSLAGGLRKSGYSNRMANEFIEILDFKKAFIMSHGHVRIYDIVDFLLNDIYYRCSIILRSKDLLLKERIYYVDRYLDLHGLDKKMGLYKSAPLLILLSHCNKLMAYCGLSIIDALKRLKSNMKQRWREYR